MKGTRIVLWPSSSLQELQAALDALRQIFAVAGLEYLLSDPDALKALGARSAAWMVQVVAEPF